MSAEIQDKLRQLPSVDEAARQATAEGVQPRWAVLQAVREQIAALRERILAGETPAAEIDLDALRRDVAALRAPALRRVINATGVVLHTNLGRAPLAAEVLAAQARVASGYSNLEYELAAGRRGSRHAHLASILREVCGAEDAVVVNNNAAAVLLCLAALARGREAIVSRGELIEIGGSFRLPDVMELSGARLREVGTTNRTHLRDYAAAIGPETALLLKVHRSNFAVVGFTAEVDAQELVALARERGLPAMFDLGSGTLVDTRRLGLPPELTVQQAVHGGFDLVTFSGDKLLGGPQAGVIVGRRDAIAAVRKHPLMRAVRPDKLTLVGLEATLLAYRDGEAEQRVPAVALLATPAERLRQRAERLRAELATTLGDPWELRAVQVSSRVGGGASPTAELPSWAVGLRHPQRGADALDARLRAADPPIVARIEEGELLLDVRTVFEEQLAELVRAAGAALG